MSQDLLPKVDRGDFQEVFIEGLNWLAPDVKHTVSVIDDEGRQIPDEAPAVERCMQVLTGPMGGQRELKRRAAFNYQVAGEAIFLSTPLYDTFGVYHGTSYEFLSVREIIPGMATAAALSAPHLAAILFPDALRRLYIVRDNDPAGDSARDSLVARANTAGIEAIVLSPELEDFNEDLRRLGIDALRANLRVQLAPADVARFWLEAG